MQVNAKTTVQMLWRDAAIPAEFQSGVSLHSHTQCSEECLDMVPKYVGKIPLLNSVIGPRIPFAAGFWTPPLTPRQAYRLEEKQIQRSLRLPALVSLSDHDSIEAGTQLHLMDRFRHVPISTEWTINVGPTFFHLGVHNLPVEHAEAIQTKLRSYTTLPTKKGLAEALRLLNNCPDVLVVVNHPLWDEKGIGVAAHRGVLTEFLREHGDQVHACEINGLRSWAENQAVLSLGREWNLPVVAGGDRHGREANAVLNLSRVASFAGFVHEVRCQRLSHVLLMPQYRTSRTIRTVQMVVDVLRTYPQMVHARQTWPERIFYRATPDSAPEPLTKLWQTTRPPFIIYAVNAAVGALSSDILRPVLRLASQLPSTS